MAPAIKVPKAMKAMKAIVAKKNMQAKTNTKPMKALWWRILSRPWRFQNVMTKGALLDELASAIGFKKLEISNALNNLAEIGTREVKKCGKFNLPGLCPITATPLSLTTIEAHRKVWELRQKLRLLREKAQALERMIRSEQEFLGDLRVESVVFRCPMEQPDNSSGTSGAWSTTSRRRSLYSKPLNHGFGIQWKTRLSQKRSNSNSLLCSSSCVLPSCLISSNQFVAFGCN